MFSSLVGTPAHNSRLLAWRILSFLAGKYSKENSISLQSTINELPRYQAAAR